jgi:single-stranded-DNA-specific exonuclease
LNRQWKIAERWQGAEDLAIKLGVSPTIAQILHNRGISDLEQASKFLEPKLTAISEPADLPDLVKAAQRIGQAIDSHEPIVIYGDYDVDGITGTAILWHIIARAGGKVDVYIPHRIEEGYGLNTHAIQKLADQGTKVLITVDCGIRDHQILTLAHELGLTTIVTDHHAPDETLPDADAVIHPARGEEIGRPVEFNPCGAAVAFKLGWAIARQQSKGEKVDARFRDLLVELTALVALATIADIVPMMGENRILVKFGLDRLSNTKLPGLQALLRSAKLDGSRVDSYHCGFVLGPRLNAAGRMGHANEALELLMVGDTHRADELAHELDKQNKARQKLEERITQEAIGLAECQGQLGDDVPILILAKENWHAGVIGIVASKLVDRFNKPVVMIALTGERGQGSARSVPGYDINLGLTACSEYLIGYGGHAMAAGLRLEAGKLIAFMQAMQAHAEKNIHDKVHAPVLDIDCVIDPNELDANFVWQLKKLGPYGHGNPRPTFASDEVELLGDPKAVGAGGKHLSFSVKWSGRIFRTIAFNQADQCEALLDHRRCRLAFEPTLDDYLGSGLVQLRVKDIQFPS